jgi:hypothetical protein
MMLIGRHRFRLLFLGAQGVYLNRDRRRAHDGRLRDFNQLLPSANDRTPNAPPKLWVNNHLWYKTALIANTTATRCRVDL